MPQVASHDCKCIGPSVSSGSTISDRARPSPLMKRNGDGMYRRVGRSCRLSGVLRLAVVVVTAVCLATANPPDQTWAAGFYDDPDHDHPILALLAIDGVVVAPLLPATG